jgi:hypothetical protein
MVHPATRDDINNRCDGALGQPAPYQQLVLLWAISRAVRGHDPLQAFSDARDELKALLAPFALGRSTPDPALPWFALRTSPWWRLIGAPSSPIHRGRDVVREGDLVGGLTRDAHRLVATDSAFRQAAVAKLTSSIGPHPALAAHLAYLFHESSPTEPPITEAIDVLSELIGQRLRTTTGASNEILAVRPPNVVVATSRSPQGQPVPISEVQRGLDLLRLHGEVTIDVDTLGHRSSFIGAVLATRDNAVVSGSPPVVSVAGSDEQGPLPESSDEGLPLGETRERSPGTHVPGQVYDRGDLHEAAREAGLPPRQPHRWYPGRRQLSVCLLEPLQAVVCESVARRAARVHLLRRGKPRRPDRDGREPTADRARSRGRARPGLHESQARWLCVASSRSISGGRALVGR